MDCSCSPVFRPSVDASSSISASLRVLSKIGFTFEGGGLQLGAWVARYQAHSKGNKLITRRNGWSLASVLDTDYVGQGPSCIYVGPLETATKDTLEALYHQARDSYYSGNPLIVDDFFDKVELKLRWYGSKSVIKYPRCSLKRQSTYADAEADPSQIWALATIWISLLVIGIVALALPPVCTLSTACQDVAHLQLGSHAFTPASKSLTVANAILSIGLGSSIGYPIATAAVRALQGLWRNDLVALKGSCPSCGEEVFAFVRANKSVRPRHKTECHVCERSLVFHVKVEHSISCRHNRWVYGRIYLVASTKDLEPEGSL